MSDDGYPSFGEFAAECGILFKKRQNTYKNAWTKMPAETITAFLEGKASRIRALLEVNGDPEKIVDDIMDIVNYAYMLYAKIKKDSADIP